MLQCTRTPAFSSLLIVSLLLNFPCGEYWFFLGPVLPSHKIICIVVHVHTSHELVQSSVHTSKHESFTFIVNHLNSELVHSSVHFLVLRCVFTVFKIHPKIIRCIRCIRWVCFSAFTCHLYETKSCCLGISCLVYVWVRWIMSNVVRSRVSWFRLGYIENVTVTEQRHGASIRFRQRLSSGEGKPSVRF